MKQERMDYVYHSMHKNHYRSLAIMTLLSFISMYVLMYAMVDIPANIFPNFNQFYMAGLMTTPMIIFELALMSMMYPEKKKNALIAGASVLFGILFFVFIRGQALIDDKQFLKSMVPHHGGAILMCQNAQIADAEIQELCDQIILSQRSEIGQMKTILNRLE